MLLPTIVLAIASLVASGIGAALMLASRAVLANSGVTLTPDVSLTNDVRDPGLVLPDVLVLSVASATRALQGRSGDVPSDDAPRGFVTLRDGLEMVHLG